LAGKIEGERPFGRPRNRLEDIIKFIFKDVVWEAWTGFVGPGQRQVECCCERDNERSVQYSAENFLASLGTASCIKNDSAQWSYICNLSILIPHFQSKVGIN